MWVAIFTALGARAAWTQDAASIRGTLSDATGSAIAGGTVHVKNTETGLARQLITDEAGRYEAPQLPVGAYEVTGEKAGFQPTRAKVKLDLGQRASVDLVLSVAELQQSIQVQETAITADVTTMETSGLVGEQQVKDLPLNGRSYDQLLTLNPGVVNYTSQRAGGIGTSNSVVGNMFSASGRRPQENLYLLNGVEYTSASEINNTPGGTSGQLLGVDAVREFSVVTDTYGAEYGKRPGAQVNIVTASGTNQLHGNAYEFLRNSALDARNYFDLGANSAVSSATCSAARSAGRSRRTRSFFFANYEGFRQDLDLSDVTLVPDSNRRAILPARCRSACRAPTHRTALANLRCGRVANGPDARAAAVAEAFSNPQQHIREDFGTARFDQTFSDKDSLAAVYTRRRQLGPSRRPPIPSASTDIYLARAGGQPERNARLLAQPSQQSDVRILPRGVLFQQRVPSGVPALARAGSTPADPVGRRRRRRRHHAQRRVANHQRRHQRRQQSHAVRNLFTVQRSGHASPTAST